MIDFEGRKAWLPPEGFKPVPGSEMTHRLPATITLTVAEFRRPLRVVERGIVLDGVETCRALARPDLDQTAVTTSYPVALDPRGVPRVRVVASGLWWDGERFCRLRELDMDGVAAGEWSTAPGAALREAERRHEKRRAAKVEPLDGASAWRAAVAWGNWSDVVKAFGDGPAADAIRETAREMVVGAIRTLKVRAASAHLLSLVDRVAGWTSRDAASPLSGEVFLEAVETAIAGEKLAKLPALVEKLMPLVTE